MTRTLQLSPSAEAILEREAATRNMALDDFLSDLAEREAQRLAANGSDANGKAARLAAIRRVRGMLAGRPGSVDDFLQERREEAEAEERQYQKRLRLREQSAQGQDAQR